MTTRITKNWGVDEAFDLRQYWVIIYQNKWAILALATVVSLLSALVAFAMTPIYSASATLLIESEQHNVVSIEEVYGLDTRSAQYFLTQFEILKSRSLAEDVIRKLDLLHHPEYDPNRPKEGFQLDWRSWVPGLKELPAEAEEEKPDPLRKAAHKYSQRLTIAPVINTQLAHVQFESEDPALAADVANAHVQAYIESMLDAKIAVTELAASWMAQRLGDMEDQLLESEQRLQAFREQEGLIDVEGLKALPAREINDLSLRLVEVRRNLALAKIAYLQVYETPNKPREDLDAVPAILTDEVVQSFQEAEADAEQRVAEFSKRYGPMHPNMVAVRSELEKATENLRNQHFSVAEGIKKKYEAAQAEEVELVKALNRAKREYQSLGRKESELVALEREVTTKRQLFDMFYSRISETSATGDMNSAQARIITTAVAPTRPTRPKKKMIVGLAFMLSSMLGIMAAFLLSALDNTIKNVGDVEDKLDMPVLGILPLLNISGNKDAPLGDIFLDESDSGFNEAIRTVRTSISLSSLDEPNKVIVITSSVGDEGKSTVSMNLAYAFAKLEKVLLIDGDMRHASIARQLGLPRHKPGLAELLANQANFSECVTRHEKGKLDILATGFIPPDPLQLLSSPHLRHVFSALRSKYDRIIVDCPPILPVSDPAVYSTHADAAIYIVKADATSTHQIKAGLGLLERVDAPIIGVVLNQLDTRKAGKYGSYGYGGYYESYDSEPMAG